MLSRGQKLTSRDPCGILQVGLRARFNKVACLASTPWDLTRTPMSLPLHGTSRVLLCFDFDHTVVDANTDTWIVRLAPGQGLPEELTSSYIPGQWTSYMCNVLRYLHGCGITTKDLRQVQEEIHITPGMHLLFTYLQQVGHKFDSVIISDSNSMFISWVLEKHGGTSLFSQVFTNPAKILEDDLMVVDEYHSHACPSCPRNMCKSAVVQQCRDKQLQTGIPYDRVVYVGDGRNDLCPALALRSGDIVLPRRGYPLEQLLQGHQADVLAQVVPWASGEEILRVLEGLT